MRKIAILICLLGLATTAYAGGNEIYIPEGGFNALTTPVLSASEYEAAQKKGFQNLATTTETTTTTETGKAERKIRFGSFKNNANTYWNHGRVNFGVGNFGNGAAGLNHW